MFCIENRSRRLVGSKLVYSLKTRHIEKASHNGVSFIISNVSDITLDFMSACPFRLRNSLFNVLSLAEKTHPPRLRYTTIYNIPFPLFEDLVEALDLSTLSFRAYVSLLLDEDSLNSDIPGLGLNDTYTSVKNITDVKLVPGRNISHWIEMLRKGVPGHKAGIQKLYASTV
ncbi:hypothetical protein TRICI_001542 [Trichomonascus ciferrii]|uniref:Uncharacterized protein n=1 Tax=Trichomonascus ciferrii TaxID=44093 RepID=A0A642V827_9ASCO|nr:hypothetical protein TRICI_001542 [Trichomonascus ciferrii]